LRYRLLTLLMLIGVAPLVVYCVTEWARGTEGPNPVLIGFVLWLALLAWFFISHPKRSHNS
jgi:hypothetical protein